MRQHCGSYAPAALTTEHIALDLNRHYHQLTVHTGHTTGSDREAGCFGGFEIRVRFGLPHEIDTMLHDGDTLHSGVEAIEQTKRRAACISRLSFDTRKACKRSVVGRCWPWAVGIRNLIRQANINHHHGEWKDEPHFRCLPSSTASANTSQ